MLRHKFTNTLIHGKNVAYHNLVWGTKCWFTRELVRYLVATFFYDFTENQSTNFRVVLIVKAKIICVMPKGRGGALPSTPPFFLHGHNQTVQH